jgi:hypothetical protein
MSLDPQRTPQQIITAALLIAMGEGAITGAEMRIAEQWFAHIREKVEYLYGGYVSGEAIRVTPDEELVVDAVWEARLFELDAMLTAAREAATTAPDPATLNEEAKFRDRERLKASGVVPIVPNPGLPISPVVPNPGLSVSPVVPNPGLPISPAPPTEGGESS